MDGTNMNEAAGGSNDATTQSAGAALPNEAGIEAAAKEVEDVIEDAGLDLMGFVQKHPVGSLLGALGVGYLVGGGLFTSLTRRLVTAGVRVGIQMAVVPAIEREIAGMAGTLGEGLQQVADKESV